MAVLFDQSVINLDGRDMIVSIVQEDKSGITYVHGRELATSREYCLPTNNANLDAILSKLTFDGSGNLTLGVPGDNDDTASEECESNSHSEKHMALPDELPLLCGKSVEEVTLHVEMTRTIVLRCVTWNLQAKPTASALELRKQLLPFERYHMIHIGTQECERSIAASLLNQSKAKWTATLKEAIGINYEALMSHTLQATHSILFVHRGVLPFLTGMRAAAVATGLGARETRLGNKGGIGLALQVGQTKLLFVTTHLAAHQKNVATRNREVTKIAGELCRLLRDCPVSRSIERGYEDVNLEVQQTEKDILASPMSSLLSVFDCVFWSGDLNYRVNMCRHDADTALASGNLAVLHREDQLKVAMDSGLVFAGFKEGPLGFKPTYKFDHVNSDMTDMDHGDNRIDEDKLDVYDTSAKRRVPSWTDRVLWACREASMVNLLEYTSVLELRSSDHRPVYAAFNLSLTGTHVAGNLTHTTIDGHKGLHQSQVCSLQ